MERTSPLFHFSENPGIAVFKPHVARTAVESEAFVWAIDEEHAPSFWFPRDCPRVCCWRDPSVPHQASADLLKLGGATRMHAIETAWLERMSTCRLYAYRLESSQFRMHLEEAGFFTSREEVTPLSVEPVGDLLARHASANIELRIVPDLWPLIDAVPISGLRFSIIRKANARPRLTPVTTV